MSNLYDIYNKEIGSFSEFKQSIADDIVDVFYRRGISISPIEFQKMNKVNYTYCGACIKIEGHQSGVVVPIDYFFREIEAGKSYSSILEKIIDFASDNMSFSPTVIDIGTITNYGMVKNKISIELIGTERNSNVLNNAPSALIAPGLAAVYRLEVEPKGIKEDNGIATILVNNSLLQKWGISMEKLHQDALENMKEKYPSVIKNLRDMLYELLCNRAEEFDFMGMPNLEDFPFPMEDAAPMYIITNGTGYGASSMLDTDVLRGLAEKHNSDLFILPSSRFEVIAIPANTCECGNGDSLREMVRDVNACEVPIEDQLTDDVYYFDRKEGVISIAK